MKKDFFEMAKCGWPTFSRVVPKARRHAMMTEGREGPWQYVKARKTFELPSGRVLSIDPDVRKMTYEELTRP